MGYGRLNYFTDKGLDNARSNQHGGLTMGHRITEFKLKAVITSTGQVIEGFHQINDFDQLVKEGHSDAEIKAIVMNDWLATQVAITEVKQL